VDDGVEALQPGGVDGAGRRVPADGVGIAGGAAHQGADGVAVGPEGVTERRADQSAGAGDGDLH
jgi:hypothetical protein